MRRTDPSFDVGGRDDRQFRRGIVMGLTLAEMFAILCFVILMLTWLDLREQDEASALADLDPAEVEQVKRLIEEGWPETVEAAKRANLRPEELTRAIERAPEEIPRDWERLVRGTPPEPVDGEDLERLIAAVKDAPPGHREALLRIAEDPSYPDASDLDRQKRIIADSALPREEIEQLLEMLKRPQQVGRLLAGQLSDNIGPQIAKLGGRINAETGAVTLDEAVLFPQGKAELTADAQVLLDTFCEGWLSTIHQFADSVSDVLIEGHASSEWKRGTSPEDAFVLNLGLSQQRSASVLTHCLERLGQGPISEWARSRVVAVGYSSARPVLTDGVEDPGKSRRVVFSVRTGAGGEPPDAPAVPATTPVAAEPDAPDQSAPDPADGAIQAASTGVPLPPVIEGFARAIDGDTLELEGKRLRLAGIDAFETAQLCTGADGAPWPCGAIAGLRLAQYLDRKPVRCETRGRDADGHPLAACRTEDGDLAVLLARDGLAMGIDDTYSEAVGLAEDARRGAWAGGFEVPSAWRAGQGASVAMPSAR